MRDPWTRLGIACALLFLTTGISEVCAQKVDLVVRQARVIDGTGGPWFLGDVAVNNGRIVAVGTNLEVDAAQSIDAAGRILAPGFIDIHTHAERGLEKLPRADNFLLDGVTTVVAGNCGGSETDIAEWSRGLTGLGINVATLVGHNTIRRQVMGLEARSPTASELEQMQALVEKAMKGGAVGFSTGLLYVPGTYADTDEVISLARVASRYGGAISANRARTSTNPSMKRLMWGGKPTCPSRFPTSKSRDGRVGAVSAKP